MEENEDFHRIGDNLSGTEEINIIDDCDFATDSFPKLDDFVTELSESQRGGVEAVSEAKDGGARLEEAKSLVSEAEAAAKVILESRKVDDVAAVEAKMKPEFDKEEAQSVANDAEAAEAAEDKMMLESPKVDDDMAAEAKMNPEFDEDDNLAVEEKGEMEKTVAEVLSEEFVGRESEDEAEDAAMEEESPVMERETQTKVDGIESVLESDNEMETEKDTEDEAEVEGSELVRHIDDSRLAEDEDEEAKAMVGEESPSVDIEMETETDAAELVKISGGKRKRGRNSKAPTKARVRKMANPVEEEDVCFICFDGGDLVLCDRKNCPKAYHPSCVNRDPNFFEAKSHWICGWHQCSHEKCQKNAYYQCYTCTFSLCKGCVKDAVILCVRGNKGFCVACMKVVMLIEENAQGNKVQVDFDDKTSWEYLFKEYWIDLKEKLSISSVELVQAKNPWKGSDVFDGKHEFSDFPLDVKGNGGTDSDNASDSPEETKSRKRKSKKRPKSRAKQDEWTGSEGKSASKNTEWASKELLEFVAHMKDGDKTVLSQFDVQALLLEYIKRNKLRDPRRKSQILCDARLENIFGKARVGHFEMLKLLESHFLIKEDAQIDDVIQGSVTDTTDVNHLDGGTTESATKSGKDKKRKTRKKDGRGRQSNLEDYAAIDIHNISLIYLRRKLMESLLEDTETFSDKVIGTFVRIRIVGSNQKQDIYRLVQVVGTSKADELYKVGTMRTDIMLEILNLNKKEVISIDSISNQEFTEDECQRLRQSIKCGFINRLTVGDVLDKAMEIQVARVNDWLESEVQRLTHLRDRASDMGKKKQLRECVEGLQLLKTPEERRRRLEDIPEIRADPHMDPSYESEDNNTEMDSNKQEAYKRPRGSGFGKRGMEPISPGSGDTKNPWSGGTRKIWELTRNLSNKNLANKVEDSPLSIETYVNNSWDQGRGKYTEKLNNESFSHVASETSPESRSALVTAKTAVEISETDKMWNYQDPQGKVQGPFSIVQLRKWNNTGFFPADLKIWRTTGNKDDTILLIDALAGKFQRELPLVDHSRNILGNLPSPTPKPSAADWAGGEVDLPVGGNEAQQSLALAATPDSVRNSTMVSERRIVNSPSGIPIGSTHGWGSGPSPPSLEANSSIHVSGQQHWGGVSTTHVQNPAQNSWGAPISDIQSNMQSANPNAGWGPVPANPNMGWGHVPNPNMNGYQGPPCGSATPGSAAQPVHGNANSGWGTPYSGNANSAWVLLAPGNANSGWRPPAPGNANSGWGTPPSVNANSGWVPPPSGNANSGWGPPTPGANSGWGTPTSGNENPGWGTPTSGNANSGWGPPSGGQGDWRSEHHHRGDRFSGQRDGDSQNSSRPWNKQSSFGGGGGSGGSSRGICYMFQEKGHCTRGTACRFRHS